MLIWKDSGTIISLYDDTKLASICRVGGGAFYSVVCIGDYQPSIYDSRPFEALEDAKKFVMANVHKYCNE